MIVSAGHGEYLPVETPGVTVKHLWPPEDIDHDVTDDEYREMYELVTGNEADPDVDYSWEVIVEITGGPNAIGDWLTVLCRMLVITPSGDDDTFDYWPSGCRLAAAVAAELADPWPDRIQLAIAAGLAGIDESIRPDVKEKLP